VTSTTVELLESHPLMARLNPEQLVRFAQAGAVESFAPGEEIVVEGTMGDSLYLLLSGTATVHTGQGLMALATLKAGEFFGEMSLIEPAKRSATVRAKEPALVFRAPHFTLVNMLADEPVLLNQVLVMIIRVLSQRLRQTNSLVGTVERLADWLAGSLV
jgi:CRP-like cAMP-binding protein